LRTGNNLKASKKGAPLNMKISAFVIAGAAAAALSFTAAVQADTFGSVEPIANPAVLDTTLLHNQSLAVRQAFAERVLSCGVVDRVMTSLARTGAITTVNGVNTRFQVGAGGFQGATNPAFVYTVMDDGPNAANEADIRVLTDSLGYVFSQFSAFLLDAKRPKRFDFPANYVVLNFKTQPGIAESARLFRAVGQIDPELFSTDSSGYTQYGRAYLSLQSFVPDQQFIDGYTQAAAQFGLEYTPLVAGVPSLFRGGAAFPGNDWISSPGGEEYLARIPVASHPALRRIRSYQLRITREVLRQLGSGSTAAFDFACE
jgi:hypothetical protein